MKTMGVSRRQFVAGASAAVVLRASGVWAQAATDPASAPVVTTAMGVVRGERSHGVRVFRGVPFAEPPVGNLRFKAPVKKAAWTGAREATRFAAAAMQPGEPTLAKSEDCLYLNVWSPEAEASAGLPVFVWIHGGGFTGGSSFAPVFDGTEFADEGVIVVTVAYRLGVLGFLDVEPLLGKEYKGSANNGVRDLIMALEWVQESIAAFGGDPAKVTLGGESAGAKLTDVLMGVPSARELFGQMISESGGAERVWPATTAKAIGRGFGKVWGKGADALKTAAAEQLIAAQTAFIAGWPQHFPLRPEVDGELIPRLPVATIADGLPLKVKEGKRRRLLIGTNRDESALFVGPHPMHDAAAVDVGNVTLAAFQRVYAKYEATYPEMDEAQLRIRALTAEEYWVPSVRVAEAFVKGGGTAWMYRLDFAATSGKMKDEAFHSEDIGLVWDKPDPKIDNAAAETVLAQQMHAAWVRFLKGQGPGAEGLVWPEYSPGLRETMVFDEVSRVEQRPQAAELQLWNGVL